MYYCGPKVPDKLLNPENTRMMSLGLEKGNDLQELATLRCCTGNEPLPFPPVGHGACTVMIDEGKPGEILAVNESDHRRVKCNIMFDSAAMGIPD
jgi:hypothetical protein